ncbi:MAG: sialate O-acetylesterase [Rhodoferax sp.]|nr:sialate O-acetylesterase [Rhodoferax sp.]
MSLQRRQLLGLSLGVASLAGCASRLEPFVQTPELDLYLLAGQSNMAGRGIVTEQDREASPLVVSLSATGLWIPAQEPLHFDKPSLVGVGPGLAFGKAMAAALPPSSGRRIGLVPCAVGGTSVALWEPGARHTDTGRLPLDDTLTRIRQASAAGRWRGLLWHQGESDCNEAAAPAYAQRLAALIARLRVATGSPALPVAIGQMGRWPGRPWTRWHELVDTAHRRTVEQLQLSVFVSSEGLNHQGDNLHFDAESARQLGLRYAKALHSLETST